MPKAPQKSAHFRWRHPNTSVNMHIRKCEEVVDMSPESLLRSIEMFKSVLDGGTYAMIAQESGLTRAAVQRRVKTLARELQKVVGVEGVNENELPDAEFMRTRKTHYLEALEHYRPQTAARTNAKQNTLSDGDLDRALSMISQHSKHKSRDAALLLVLFATAAKPLEIARLEVRDYLNEDGSVREESVLRAEAAVTGKERPLFFASKKAIAIIDEYLKDRLQRDQGINGRHVYRGLDPHSRLFLTDEGFPMPIRVSAGSKQERHFCRAILDIYRRLFRTAGLKGVSALCARRTVAKRLLERGCDVDQIGAVLGLKGRNAVRKLIVKEPPVLKAAVRELV